ncbi:MAG: hypothetical protein RIR68_2118 [Pseudomonadota bacterium]|jgi:hypothetical protein
MDNLIFVIGILFVFLAGFLVFYIQTQMNFKELQQKLEVMREPPKANTTVENLKREMALHHDKLVLLEADISKNRRESLTEEELQTFDLARRKIRGCIAMLKSNGGWIGLPFEFEWTEMLERLPNLQNLYKKAELEKQALLQAQDPESGAQS